MFAKKPNPTYPSASPVTAFLRSLPVISIFADVGVAVLVTVTTVFSPVAKIAPVSFLLSVSASASTVAFEIFNSEAFTVAPVVPLLSAYINI